MTQSYDSEELPSPSSALLQLARLKAGMSQRELAERAGVPVSMISAYERDQRQPTLATLLRLLHAAGFDLRLHLAAYDPHDDILAALEAGRSATERLRRDRQLQAWRMACCSCWLGSYSTGQAGHRLPQVRTLWLPSLRTSNGWQVS